MSSEFKYSYKYPRAALTADCVIFSMSDCGSMGVLLVKRGNEPFKGQYAFPGGFMNMDETLEECAIRELREETGIEVAQLDMIGVYSDVDRDPRDRVVSTAFMAVVERAGVHGGDDAAAAEWIDAEEARKMPLAFDHDTILEDALAVLQGKKNLLQV